MKKKLLFAVLFCTALHAMDHEPDQFQLPNFVQIKAEDGLPLPIKEGQPDYTHLTFDTADDGFYSAFSEPSKDIISLTLHTHPPTGAVAFGASRPRGTFELFGDCDRPITGFDMSINPENPKEKAFAVCRQEGWCTLFDLEDGAFVNKWITHEDFIACYFESSKTIICVSATEIYRWNFTVRNHAVTHLGVPHEVPRMRESYITIPKNSLGQERDEGSDDDESFHTCSSGDGDQQTEQAPRKNSWGHLRWLLFGRKPFRR